jgi:uncharacterized protein YggE
MQSFRCFQGLIAEWRIVTTAALLFHASSAGAQTGAVTGIGGSEIRRLPDSVRVSVEIRGEGPDVRAALTALKARQEAVRGTLGKLGAESGSIRFDDAKAPAIDGQRAQREMMMRTRQAMRGKRGKKPAAKAPSIVLASKLSAEWKIKAADVDELLISAAALEDKIRAADLGGQKAAEAKLKAEQDEETNEEMQDMMMQMGGNDNEAKPYEPTFVFIRRIATDEREKALREAFGKAKDDATRLAQAAGMQLGELKTLGEQPGGGDDGDDGDQRRYYYQMMRAGRLGRVEADALEATGVHPGTVSYRVTVTATFGLK